MEELSDPGVFEQQLQKCINHYQLVLQKIRSGSADSGIIRNLKIDIYGSKLELYQIASITIPEPRLIQITPFNKNDVKVILKSIHESNLNLNPTSTESVIRIVLSSLTTEQKKLFIKEVKKESEKAKITLRGIRRKARDQIEKDKVLPITQRKLQQEKLEKILKQFVKKIDDLTKEKIIRIEKV